MNKLFKGALAGAAGVALLLGGAGTFALWQDTTDMGTNQTINSGRMYFAGDLPEGEWRWGGADDQGTAPFLDSDTIVPGDVVTWETELTDAHIRAEGTNLSAILSADFDTALTNATAEGLDQADDLAELLRVRLHVNGVEQSDPAAVITPELLDDGVTVAVTVEFPAGPGFAPTTGGQHAAGQGQTVELGDVTLTLSQTR